MYSELQDEAEGTFGFGKTDNLVDTAKDYFSGMSDVEKDNAQKALSAYNDQQFSDFVSQDEVYGGGSASDDNNNDGGMGFGADDAASGADDAMGDGGNTTGADESDAIE